MAEKHRFKEHREFKKRLDEPENMEDEDIRSFRFRKSPYSKDIDSFENKRERRPRTRERRSDDERRGGRKPFDKGGRSFGRGGDRKGGKPAGRGYDRK